MRALKERWTPTSRLYDRADEGQPRRFVLDCGIAWQNYRDTFNSWQPIDLTPQPSDQAGYDLVVPGLPFKPYFSLNGARRLYTDRNDTSRYVSFPANRFLAGKTFTQEGNSLIWRSQRYDVVMRWENSRVKFDVVLKRPPPNAWGDQIQFDVDKTGLDDATLLSYLTGLKAVDSSTPFPIVRPLSVSLSQGVLTLGFDLTGMTYPVTIDPTLDLQVGAGADDVFHDLASPHRFVVDAADQAIGNFNTTYKGMGGSHRFTNVTVGNGDTIDVAYLTLTADITLSGATCIVVIDAEAADSGDAPISDADWDNEIKTAATVSWNPVPSMTIDLAYNTPSIITVVQELINRAGWASGNAINLFVHDEALASSTGAWRRSYSYESSTTKAAKLHIEYTAAGPVQKTGTDTGSGTEANLKERDFSASAETGSGTEANLKERQFSATSESGSGAEAQVKERQFSASADSGSATEAQVRRREFAASDQGQGTDSAVLQQVKPKPQGVGRLIFPEKLTVTYMARLSVTIEMVIWPVFLTTIISSTFSHAWAGVAEVGLRAATAMAVRSRILFGLSGLVTLSLQETAEMGTSLEASLQGGDVSALFRSRLLAGAYRRAMVEEYEKILV